MKKTLTVIACCISLFNTASATEKTYSIMAFSKKYSGAIVSDGESNTVIIKNQQTNKPVISLPIEAFDAEYDVTKGRVKSNVLEMPYGEQSIIIADDFNFDGKKDIAIRDANHSCYGGPSYQVYLETGETLKHSPEFTRLAQEYCGMFATDEKTQTLSTMTKSGAAWHEYSVFRVIDNKPVAIFIESEDLGAELPTYDKQMRINGKMVESRYSILPIDYDTGKDAAQFIFAYTVLNGKQMVLGTMPDQEEKRLFYAFRSANKHVELFYDTHFTVNKDTQSIAFKRGKIEYLISAENLRVLLPKRTLTFPVYRVDAGSMDDVLSGNFVNVSVE